MQIASQHAETVRKGARVGVEERLLLDGIALHTAYIAPWNVELSAPIEANLAHSRLAFGNGAAVPASEAAYAIALNRFVQLAFTHILI